MPASARESRVLAREKDPAITVARSDGPYLFDTRSRKFVDFTAGWCVGNFGWDNPAIVRKAAHFRGPDYVYPGYSYGPWVELAELLSSIAPARKMKCFRATGGSEAVDIALQAAMIHTGRRRLMSLEDSYHGNSLGTLSVGSSEYRDKIPNLLPGCTRVKPPLDDRALGTIERELAKEDVAAFIMEPIVINLGVLVPEKRFMKQLRRLCRRHGTLLIMDEVASGFGRTGTVFATEQFDIQPDIVCIAKAVTGGAGGLGAALMTQPVAKSMEDDGNFYSTYGWHPRSVHVAIATINYLIGHKDWLLNHVARMSEHFRKRLSEMAFESEPKLNIRGLAIGVDVDDEDYASRIEEKARRKGLLVTTEGSIVLMLPALNIRRSVADEGLDIFEASA
jgi:4-aminobutyrate aminotransferase-like enzyme